MTISFNQTIGKAHVESHTFYEFLQEVQKLTTEGYILCLENDYFPTQYIGYWSAYFDTAVTQQVPDSDQALMGIIPPSEDDLIPFTDKQDAALAELVALSQEEVEVVLDKIPAAVVNAQSADRADDIPVAPAVADAPKPNAETQTAMADADQIAADKPKRGRPRLTRDTNTTD